jgi:hypothetical protein
VPRVLQRTSIILVSLAGSRICNDSIIIVSINPAINVSQKLKEYRFVYISKSGLRSNPSGTKNNIFNKIFEMLCFPLSNEWSILKINPFAGGLNIAGITRSANESAFIKPDDSVSL